MPESYLLSQILPIFFLVVLSAFFSSSETALTSISETLLQKKIFEGDPKAIKTQKLLLEKDCNLILSFINHSIILYQLKLILHF